MKSLKKNAPQKQLTSVIVDSANQIWLAGLGALARAQVEGNKVFEALVDAGRKIEEEGKRIAGDRVGEATGRAVETWDKLETVFQDRVARSLSRLGVPTESDVKALSKRVEELTDSVNALLGKPASKAAAKPTAANVKAVEPKADAKPATAKPTVAKPAAAKPTAAKPAAAKPATTPSTVTKPAAKKVDAPKAAVAKPADTKAAAKPATANQAAVKPVAAKAAKPATEKTAKPAAVKVAAPAVKTAPVKKPAAPKAETTKPAAKPATSKAKPTPTAATGSGDNNG
ncbi:phasin family protein [Chitinivorax sp. B]|uniref:phasin family protein n=1 Tax=Chitinivorax sp. B TaxID=2502235 RepID=UPI0010F60B5A|nr:phasin family protein [Chitinivorax sp. B]